MKKIIITAVVAFVAFMFWNEKVNRQYVLGPQGEEALNLIVEGVGAYDEWEVEVKDTSVDLTVTLGLDPLDPFDLTAILLASDMKMQVPGWCLFIVLGDGTLSDAERVMYESQMQETVLQSVHVETYYDINIRILNPSGQLVWHFFKKKEGGGEFLFE